MRQSALEREFIFYWRQICAYAPKPVEQYQGIPDRRHRFDFAWPEQLVAVELQGGTWMHGRHTRGGGYRADCEKLNLAQEAGWRVFYLTGDMLHEEPLRWLTMIAEMIANW